MMSGDPSRPFKWVTLVCSAVTIGFLVAAAVRENVSADWRGLQTVFRGILETKAKDDAGRATARNLPIEIRQVVVPALHTVDRCVTCHLGIDDPRMEDQPNPHRTHPKWLLAIHRVEKFGCTVCHQGQGAALNFDEAKAEDYFWDYPLLPAKFTEATCAACHDPRALPAGSADKLVLGMRLFEQKHCNGCHKLNGKGGQLGPALDNEGLKTKHQFVRASLKGSQTTWNWFAEHFRDPAGIVAGSLMPMPALSQPQVEALTVYMLSLRQRDLPAEYLAPDKIDEQYARLHPPAPDGGALYKRYCAACHDTGLHSRWDKKLARFVPGIRNAAFVRTEDDECLAENIREGRPGTRMPGWGPKAGGLSEVEVAALVAYLRTSAPAMALPAAPPRGDITRGAALFAQQCAGCHGLDGKGLIAPALANPVFQKAATDAFIAQTIRAGREHSPMPAFGRAGLSESQIGDVLAYVRKWQPQAPPNRSQNP
ncbi:MAG TPA: c-type cytochrome [Bryobacteraceae bacterium]|nr:c-type cytochrome [Bryobacteraceae bacterium]